MKRGDVPRNVRADADQELRQVAQLGLVAILAGYQQRDNLQPDAPLMHLANAAAHVRQGSAQRAMLAVVETLEVNFIGTQPRLEKVERFGGGIPV